jgi:hypothetical protein
MKILLLRLFIRAKRRSYMIFLKKDFFYNNDITLASQKKIVLRTDNS